MGTLKISAHYKRRQFCTREAITAQFRSGGNYPETPHANMHESPLSLTFPRCCSQHQEYFPCFQRRKYVDTGWIKIAGKAHILRLCPSIQRLSIFP